MPTVKLSRKAVIAISAAFAMVLVAAFWWRLNPAWNSRSYYQDAARMQQMEGGQMLDEKGKVVGPAPLPIASDKTYQPESGAN